MSNQMTPVEVISSFEKHIECEVMLGLASLDDCREKCVGPLLIRLKALRPSMLAVTDALDYLGNESKIFSLEQRQSFGKAINATMDLEGARSFTRTAVVNKTQQHLHLHNYLPKKLWGALESADTKINKFKLLAQFMGQCLGLKYPDAQTKRLAVVIVHLASGEDPEPRVAYEDVFLR